MVKIQINIGWFNNQLNSVKCRGLQDILWDIFPDCWNLPIDAEYLRVPRKWEVGDIGRFMLFIGPISSIFDYTTFALMWFYFHADTEANQSLFQSGWFIEGLLSQTLIVHMIRTGRIPFVQSTASAPLLILTISIMAIGMYLPFSPIAGYFGLQPLPSVYFIWLFATLLSYCGLTQLIKMLYIRKFGTWL